MQEYLSGAVLALKMSLRLQSSASISKFIHVAVFLEASMSYWLQLAGSLSSLPHGPP